METTIGARVAVGVRAPALAYPLVAQGLRKGFGRFSDRPERSVEHQDRDVPITSTDGIHWPNQDISTTSWDPNLGFFKSGAFIGDYIGVNASTTHIYPTWADGRTTQIAVTGIGNTDIFTNVEVVKK